MKALRSHEISWQIQYILLEERERDDGWRDTERQRREGDKECQGNALLCKTSLSLPVLLSLPLNLYLLATIPWYANAGLWRADVHILNFRTCMCICGVSIYVYTMCVWNRQCFGDSLKEDAR